MPEATASATNTWHFRASIHDRYNPRAVDWYVEKNAYALVRRRYTQFTPGGKPAYVEDAAYAGFNSSLTVRPPVP